MESLSISILIEGASEGGRCEQQREEKRLMLSMRANVATSHNIPSNPSTKLSYYPHSEYEYEHECEHEYEYREEMRDGNRVKSRWLVLLRYVRAAVDGSRR